MAITSFAFLAFLFVIFVLYYICPPKGRWLVLLAASLYFYIISGAVLFIPFIAGTSFIVWICSVRIGQIYARSREMASAPGLDKKQKKAIKARYQGRAAVWLFLAIILCIGYLCVVKFTKYVTAFLNSGAGFEKYSAAWVIVPLGISYYTFSTVGYILDVYWRRYEYEKNPVRFFLYAIYFPHIMQGPISRYSLLGQELKKEVKFDSRQVVFGFELMLYGFFKKLVIADRLNIFLKTIYNGSVDHPGSLLLLAMICDSFMIYMDFSGYTDIVRGASQIFGIDLEQNFNHPFFSRTVSEFWRRWHMTLGGWFRDYVYYPITIAPWMKNINKFNGKHLPKRVTRFVTVVIPVMITWVCTGLWHGTGETYLAWGIYYGVLITLSTAFEPELTGLKKFLAINDEAASWKWFQTIRTFLIFTGGRVLTSPGSLANTRELFHRIATDFQPWILFDQSLFTYGLTASQWLVIIFGLLLVWRISIMQEQGSVRELLSKQNIVFRWAVIYIAIFSILIFGIYGPGFDASSFVYMQF
jgi:D-alanyl-lipoteichoic acid acyltransferase DltB (MBOAT superfamily)